MGKTEEESKREKIIQIQKEKEKMQNEEILTRLGLGKDFRVLERYTEEDYTADQLAAICAEKSAASRKKRVFRDIPQAAGSSAVYAGKHRS